MQAEGLQRQIDTLRTELRDHAAAASAIKARATARESDVTTLEDEVACLTAERSDFDERIGQLQAMLTSTREARTESGKGAAAVQARLQEALEESARLAARLRVLEEDRASMQTQLREVFTPCAPTILHECPWLVSLRIRPTFERLLNVYLAVLNVEVATCPTSTGSSHHTHISTCTVGSSKLFAGRLLLSSGCIATVWPI